MGKKKRGTEPVIKFEKLLSASNFEFMCAHLSRCDALYSIFPEAEHQQHGIKWLKSIGRHLRYFSMHALKSPITLRH